MWESIFIFIAIFVIKIIEVAISTRQIGAIAKGHRKNATILGGISCVLWLLALRATIFDGFWGFMAYCTAYTTGTWCGFWGTRK